MQMMAVRTRRHALLLDVLRQPLILLLLLASQPLLPFLSLGDRGAHPLPACLGVALPRGSMERRLTSHALL